MIVSKFGRKFTGSSGILQLMHDLGEAVAGEEEVLMLGGGNPAVIPEVQERFRQRMYRMLEEDGEFGQMISSYGPPQGEKAFLEALANLLNREHGWDLGPENVALTNGSQTAFFFLFNLFAGELENGTRKKILLPLAPEYIGYVDVGLGDDFFVASRPEIQFLDEHTFKYRVDFSQVAVTDEIGAICVSRPTNPTGNVLTADEIEGLSDLARENGIPLILDNAYGTPFPNIIFTEAQPVWDEHIVLCMSLSKLGLPGARTGIIVANEEVTAAVAGMNAVISLAPGTLGAVLARELVENGDIIRLSQELVRPYYERKRQQARTWLREEMGDLDCYAHKPEGTFFFWLWFKDLPITCQELYERLKKRGVLVVPGHYFFPGLEGEWGHKHECIRVNYSQDGEVVKEGIRIIADEARKVYSARNAYANAGSTG